MSVLLIGFPPDAASLKMANGRYALIMCHTAILALSSKADLTLEQRSIVVVVEEDRMMP